MTNNDSDPRAARAPSEAVGGPRPAIVVRLQDGLGNQLFQYALGQSLAARLGTALEFDLSWYENPVDPAQKRSLALREFAVRGTFSSADSYARYWLRPGMTGRLRWQIEQRLLPIPMRRFVEQKPSDFLRRGKMFDPAVLRVRPGTYLSGWWISPLYFASAEVALRRDLALRSVPTAAAQRWCDAIRARNAVAVHVRRGDYLKHPEIGTLDAAYYARAFRAIRERVTDPSFFVFSDDVPAARALLRETATPFEVVELEPEASPAQDLMVMAACRHFVIANSTFSWWGAWLAQGPARIVIAPEFWYAGARVRMPDVYPPEWIEVPC
ncbi:MAG: alpha-1,2-fucosyltransferase [Burkholderiales bacterium]|nr:alpha-1,2-fucosyltransferase [Burkholderiales bacterium]